MTPKRRVVKSRKSKVTPGVTPRVTPKKRKKTQLPQRDWRDVFIDELGECANVSASAAEAGVSRKTVYQERKADAGFAHAWDEAIETALDRAEGELYRRAVEGVEEPVFYKGDIVGAIRRYSDTALIFMLKTRRRSIYGDRSTNLNLDMSRLTTQQLERIANGEDPAIVLATPGDGRAGAETAGTTGTE